MKKVQPYLKSVAGFVVGGLVAYLGAKDGGVNGDEWIKILLAALAGSGLVYGVPNLDPKGRHQDESVQPPNRQHGYGAVELLVAVVLVILIVWLLLRLVG